jgi:GntR family transcriptional regulator
MSPPKSTDIGPIDNVPLTERARTAILQAILEKRFDRRLPSEEALAQMLNVSRTTIRAALQSLEQDGIITRKRAIGTTINAHVRPSALALQRMVGFDSLLREKGHDVEVKVEWERGKPSADQVKSLGVPPDQDSMLTAKSYFADGSLAIFVADVMPWAYLSDPDFDRDVLPSIFEFTGRECRKPVDHAVAEILPLVKQGKQSTRLPIKAGTPFIRLHEHHYARDGDLIAVSTVDVDSAYFHFEVFRRPRVEA